MTVNTPIDTHFHTPPGAVQRIEAVAKALSDQIRIRILASIAEDPLNLQQLTQMFGLAPSTMSKHLSLLEDANLILAQRVGKWRYFHAANNTEDPIADGALRWVAAVSAADPLLESDAARRAVALTLKPAPAPKGDREKVLFLCTANACRSQMAEGILRQYGGHRFEVFSAGVAPRPIPPLTVEVMREIGVDIGRQKPKSVMTLIGRKHFDYLITVCPVAETHTPVFPGVTRRVHWPMDDPLKATGSKQARLAVFRRVRDELLEKIRDWIGEPPDFGGAKGKTDKRRLEKRSTAPVQRVKRACMG
jgi:arsenate reductase